MIHDRIMMVKRFAAALLLACMLAGKCLADTTPIILSGDDSITGSDGTVYRVSPGVSPAQAVAAATANAAALKRAGSSQNHSGIGNINASSFASKALHYSQPQNSIHVSGNFDRLK